MPDRSPQQLADQLTDGLQKHSSCAVAFSGGVDSAVVAKAAFQALGPQAVAVTGVGPAVADSELDYARRTAQQIGIEHVEVATHEIDRAGYIANHRDRCYHCKTELYDVVQGYAREHGIAVIANGTNTDDLGDYRPGLQAAIENLVVSPLIECNIDKAGVRALANFWQLEVWDKPASPCLASRLAYGQQVTPERLRRIELAEKFLREHGFAIVRVRYHAGDAARVEVPLADIPRLEQAELHAAMASYFTELGFASVTVDPTGFRSGSLNEALGPLVEIRGPGE